MRITLETLDDEHFLDVILTPEDIEMVLDKLPMGKSIMLWGEDVTIGVAIEEDELYNTEEP